MTYVVHRQLETATVAVEMRGELDKGSPLKALRVQVNGQWVSADLFSYHVVKQWEANPDRALPLVQAMELWRIKRHETKDDHSEEL